MAPQNVFIPLLGIALVSVFVWRGICSRQNRKKEELHKLQGTLQQATLSMKQARKTAENLLEARRVENDFAYRVDEHADLAGLLYQLHQREDVSVEMNDGCIFVSPIHPVSNHEKYLQIITPHPSEYLVSVATYCVCIEHITSSFMEHLLRENAAHPAIVFGLATTGVLEAWLTINSGFEAGEVEEQPVRVAEHLMSHAQYIKSILGTLEEYGIVYSHADHAALMHDCTHS